MQAQNAFIRKAMKQPLLSAEDEFSYIQRWQTSEDKAALDKLITPYIRLVVSIAHKFRHYGLPVADLIQEGTLGLMVAAERFDLSKEVRFSTYSQWWIRSHIQDYILKNWSIVRVGSTSSQKSLFFNLKKLREQIEKRSRALMEHDGREEIARELSVNLADVETMEQRLTGNDYSLNSPLNDNEAGSAQAQDMMVDERATAEDVVIGFKNAETRSLWLREALEDLTDRERTIIKKRRLTDDSVTLETLGAELGVSKERVRQLEVRAMEKMRLSLEDKAPTPLDLLD